MLYTIAMKNVKKIKKAWKATSVPNLARLEPSGGYYVRVRIAGKLVFRSLGTDVFTTAKLLFPDKLKEIRAQVALRPLGIARLKTFGDAREAYELEVNQNIRLKAASKRYRLYTIKFIQTTWPGIADLPLAKLTQEALRDWAMRLNASYAPSVVNNTIGTMRAILEIPRKQGLIPVNPAMALVKVRVRNKELNLPSTEQFKLFVDSIRKAGARQSQDCGNMVEFLAYTGLRVSEAAQILWADVDFIKKCIRVRGDKVDGTKNHERRSIPMNESCTTLLQAIKARLGNEDPTGPVLQVNECQKAMNNAAKKVGMSRITHHDLRHYFATRCIESGVDIPTVSRWLGHKDGGALAMKVYGHLRDEHSQKAAEKVTF